MSSELCLGSQDRMVNDLDIMVIGYNLWRSEAVRIFERLDRLSQKVSYERQLVMVGLEREECYRVEIGGYLIMTNCKIV